MLLSELMEDEEAPQVSPRSHQAAPSGANLGSQTLLLTEGPAPDVANLMTRAEAAGL